MQSLQHLWLGLAWTLLVAGCASSPPASDPLGVTPEDFTVDLTILTGENQENHPEAHLRQSRIILLADGSLLSGFGEQIGVQTRPGLTRQLDRDQVTALWALADQLGLSDPANADYPGNLGLVPVNPDEIAWLLRIGGDDQRWGFVRTFDNIQEQNPAMQQFIRTLANLAWATDQPERLIESPPRRYDFGPDPYERYR